MRIQTKAVAILVATVFWSTTTFAQSHPQEVLDLIAQHQALAAKVRPLIKRVSDPDFAPEDDTGFRPEGAPVRATVTTSDSGSRSEPEQRVPERLGHRDRANAASDDAARIVARLTALETQARTERERIMRPNFGVDTNRNSTEGGDIRFGDNIRGTRPPPGSANNAAASSTVRVDTRAIATARNRLAALERELTSIENEINARDRQR